MADPGFPRGRTNLERVAPTYYLANFPGQLNENEDILVQAPCRNTKCDKYDNIKDGSDIHRSPTGNKGKSRKWQKKNTQHLFTSCWVISG